MDTKISFVKRHANGLAIIIKQNYTRAIAYYDSADTKYRDVIANAGDNYYEEFIPRRYKISHCFLELKNINQAISILTPYIFDHRGSNYFDSSMTSYYVSILNLKYTNAQIKNELKTSVDSLKYKSTIRSSTDGSAKFLNVTCRIKIFNTDIELAGFETLLKIENTIPPFATEEFFIKRFKALEIYRRIQN